MSLDKARALFVELISNVPQEEWDGRLAELAGGDEELRRQVARILAAHRDAGSFLESPAPALGATIDEPPCEAPGAIIGPYKLLEQIGEGGMGTVWMAQQVVPNRARSRSVASAGGQDGVCKQNANDASSSSILQHPLHGVVGEVRAVA